MSDLLYYLRVCIRHDLIRERKPRRAWNHFWSQRWFWSHGRLGPTPRHYHSDHFWEQR